MGSPALAATDANVTSPPTGLLTYRPDVPDGFTLAYTLENDALAKVVTTAVNTGTGLCNMTLTIYAGSTLTIPGAAVYTLAVGITGVVINTIEDIAEANNGGYPVYEVEYIYECENPMQYGYPYVYWHLFEHEVDVQKQDSNGDKYWTTETCWSAYYELPVLPR